MNVKCCGTLITLYFTAFIQSSFEETFRINRSVEQNEFYYGSRDKFVIPSSTCSRSKCFQFGSETTGNTCLCICPFSKPSFIYRAGKWSCDVDDKMKNEEDCGFGTTPMYYLEETSTNHLKVPEPNQQCSVNETASRYRDCDGTWKPIGKNRGFQMNKISQTGYDIMIRAATGTPDIAGRIIKLVLNCRPNKGNPCYLFKIIGRVECPVDVTESTTPASLSKTEFSTANASRDHAEVQDKKGKSDSRGGPTVNVTAIASGVVVTLAVLVASLFATVFYLRHRRKSRERQMRPSSQREDPENKMRNESKNMNDMFAQANPIYDGPVKVQKGLPVKDRPPIPTFMMQSGQDKPQKPPVKPRRKKQQRTGGNGIVCELAAKLRNTPASSSDNLQQPTQKESAQESVPKKRKKPSVLPKPASRQKPDFQEESDEYDDYDSDEWDSFSESEYSDHEGVQSENNVRPNTGQHRTPEKNDVINNGPAHTSNTTGGQGINNGNKVYESAEKIDGQPVISQPRKSELSRRISGMSSDGHAVVALQSEGKNDVADKYDTPENIIFR